MHYKHVKTSRVGSTVFKCVCMKYVKAMCVGTHVSYSKLFMCSALYVV
jgi:hypothetical protein